MSLLSTARSQLKLFFHCPTLLSCTLPRITSSKSCSTLSSLGSISASRTSGSWGQLNRISTSARMEVSPSPKFQASKSVPPEMEALYHGNQRFRDRIANSAAPNILKDLAAQGQRPPFLILDCSDSRVMEQAIFSAEPGTFFKTGNIANQFQEQDLNSNAVLAYAVETLKVKHVIVMGHYGCGGVAAATVPAASEDKNNPVQNWITPIREIYETSQREEIVSHRARRGKIGEQNTGATVPHLHDPAFRALVEENVKTNVRRVARSSVITKHYASLASHPDAVGVFIHGWVYDIETGEVADLGVTVSPPGRSTPSSPFPMK